MGEKEHMPTATVIPFPALHRLHFVALRAYTHPTGQGPIVAVLFCRAR